MLRGGYGQVTDGLASTLDVRLNCPVNSVKATETSVVVTTTSGTPPPTLHPPSHPTHLDPFLNPPPSY